MVDSCQSKLVKVVSGEPKISVFGSPDTTLTSLLLQQSTITYRDRCHKNYLNIDNNIHLKYPQSRGMDL